MTTKTIEYFYSVASGYSYLGAGRFYDLAARSGSKVIHRPVYLRIVLERTGAIQFQDRHPLRIRQMVEDLGATGAYHGIPINSDPSHHYDNIEAAAGMVAVLILQSRDPSKLSFLMQQALWRDDRSLADVTVLDDLATQAGLDGPALRAEAKGEAAQDLLQKNSLEAAERGVIGAPTYIVEGRAIFGQDRLHHLEAILAGRL